MKLTIEKKGYSSKPWRLITGEGREVEIPVVMDHPMIGKTIITQSVSGNTKRECTDAALDLLARLIERVNTKEDT